MDIRFGFRNIHFPSSVMGELRDSAPHLGDMPALKQRMQADGFLLLRGLLDRDTVLKGRETILTHMAAHQALTPNTPLLEGVMPRGGRSVQMMGRKGIANHSDVMAVVENATLFQFFEAYFGEPAITFTFKWLRAVGNDEYTGAHMDTVYMGRGSPRLHTVWIPLGDIDVQQGTLAVCVGSHRLDSFKRIRDTYGRMDVDRDGLEGWFSKDPMEMVEKFGGEWVTGDFFAGDVMVFGMHTMHASTTNLTQRFRLSCDVRFQPASDPADPRWVGESGGHSAGPFKPIDEARSEWGL